MTTDGTPANPSAHLYGPRGRIAATAGVLVAADVAAFSPWPKSFGFRTPFTIRIVSADGGSEEWNIPLEVVYLRLTGAPERTNVAGVRLQTPSQLPVVLGARLQDEMIVEALADTGRGSRGALVGLSPDRFRGLGSRSSRPPTVARSLPRADRPRPQVPASFSVSTGPPKAAERSLCRIFRWD